MRRDTERALRKVSFGELVIAPDVADPAVRDRVETVVRLALGGQPDPKRLFIHVSRGETPAPWKVSVRDAEGAELRAEALLVESVLNRLRRDGEIG